MKKKGKTKGFSPKYLAIGQGLFIFSLVGFVINYSKSKKDNFSSFFSKSTNKECYPECPTTEAMQRVSSYSERTPTVAGVSKEQIEPLTSQESSIRPFSGEDKSKNDLVTSGSNENLRTNQTIYNSPCVSLLRVRNLEGRGIGYNHGYSTLEGLIFPIRTEGNFWPFFDLRFHYFNNNEFAANGGLGVRYNVDKQKIIYGLNVYYDYRSDHHQSINFNQIGAGFELLWKELDFRVNGYFPLESEKTLHRRFIDDKDNDSLTVRRKVRAALSGFNAEFGRSILKIKNLSIYGAIGPYYYGGDVRRNTFGGQFRLDMRIAKYITLEGRVTYDHLFNTRGEGIIGLNFPLGCPKSNKPVQNRLTQHVQRNEIIVFDKYNM